MTETDGPSLALAEGLRPTVELLAHRTPLIESAWLSRLHGAPVWLKCENLQRTGSFKLRGAAAAVGGLTAEERRRGVVACSAGNHGRGLALAAREAGVPCRIAVPKKCPGVKREAIAAAGATLEVSPHDGYDATHAWMAGRLPDWGGVEISAFEHAGVIAGGGGTLALEMLEQLPSPPAAFVVPCGGGGMSVGVGLVTRERAPETRVVAVNTDASPGMWRSRRDGHAHLELESEATIADGIEGGIGPVTWELSAETIDDVVLAREATIRRAVRELCLGEKLVVEGAGAAGVAALLDGVLHPGPLCIVLSGGNIDPALLAELLTA